MCSRPLFLSDSLGRLFHRKPAAEHLITRAHDEKIQNAGQRFVLFGDECSGLAAAAELGEARLVPGSSSSCRSACEDRRSVVQMVGVHRRFTGVRETADESEGRQQRAEGDRGEKAGLERKARRGTPAGATGAAEREL